jgi:NagD protein
MYSLFPKRFVSSVLTTRTTTTIPPISSSYLVQTKPTNTLVQIKHSFLPSCQLLSSSSSSSSSQNTGVGGKNSNTVMNANNTINNTTLKELATPSHRRMDISAADMRHAKNLLQKKNAFIVDCDGVIYHSDRLLPGAREFVWWLYSTQKKFIFLTNSSDKTCAELANKFAKLGLDFVDETRFFTSAMATAAFLASQKDGGARAFVVGQTALKDALKDKGLIVVSEKNAEISNPDFVVMGETSESEVYNYEVVALAIKLVRRGARLVATNEDLADRVGAELHPGTGAMVLPVSAVCGVEPFFCGKPSPLMVMNAMERLGSKREETVFIGDRMNTDIRAGVEAQVDTVLVLSGVTSEQDLARYNYRPSTVLNGVGDIPSILGEQVEVPAVTKVTK